MMAMLLELAPASRHKRKLTENEIENLIDFIKPSTLQPEDVASSLSEKLKNKFRNQLSNVEVYDSIIPKLKQELERQYWSSLIQPGESCGVVTAQSIGERQTQQTLSAFHMTGLTIKTVVTGVPRFTELTSATKDPKVVSCSIHFIESNQSIQELRKAVNHTMAELTLKNLTKNYTIVQDKQPEDWYDIFKTLYSGDFEAEGYNYCLSYQLDVEKLFEFSLPLSFIASRLEGEYEDLKCVFSPEHLGQLDIFVDTKDIQFPENSPNFIEDLDGDSARYIYLEEIVVPRLESIIICGIPGIKNIFFDKRSVKDNEEWIVETEGSNYKAVLAHPLVDVSKTVSDNMWDIFNTLGVEATRAFLIDEFSKVISSDGTFVNQSHIMLLVDIMTFSGTVISISRYGLKKENCGPMAKASFEESLDNFLRAGVYGEKESTNGVSASIMLGKLPRIGTGLCDLMVDVKKLPKKMKNSEEIDGLLFERRIDEEFEQDEKEKEFVEI